MMFDQLRFPYPGSTYDPKFGSWANPLPFVAMQGLGGLPASAAWGNSLPYEAPGFRTMPFPLAALGAGLGLGALSAGTGGFGSSYQGLLSQQFRQTGLPTDAEIEEIINDALDQHPAIPLDADIEIKTDGGQVVLSGTVPDKRIKRAAGEIAWWIPGVTDVNNTIVVSGRRQAQASRRRRRQETGPAAR
jgi:hypothetical protein